MGYHRTTRNAPTKTPLEAGGTAIPSNEYSPKCISNALKTETSTTTSSSKRQRDTTDGDHGDGLNGHTDNTDDDETPKTQQQSAVDVATEVRLQMERLKAERMNIDHELRAMEDVLEELSNPNRLEEITEELAHVTTERDALADALKKEKLECEEERNKYREEIETLQNQVNEALQELRAANQMAAQLAGCRSGKLIRNGTGIVTVGSGSWHDGDSFSVSFQTPFGSPHVGVWLDKNTGCNRSPYDNRAVPIVVLHPTPDRRHDFFYSAGSGQTMGPGSSRWGTEFAFPFGAIAERSIHVDGSKFYFVGFP